MFKILINDEINTLGLITFKISKTEDGYVTEGILKTHKYIEEITTLECERFRIEGVDVFEEAFGSSDVFNLYRFTYKSFDIKEVEELKEEELIKLYEKELL